MGQIEPFSHFFRFPAEPFVSAAVLAPVFPQTGRPEFRDPGYVDEQIDGKIAVLRPGKLVPDVARDPKLVAIVFLAVPAKQIPEIIEQTPLRRITNDIGGGIKTRKSGSATPSRAGSEEGLRLEFVFAMRVSFMRSG